MYSAYKLNKQGDNIQSWRTPFPTWNRSAFPCPVLTVASWHAYRFLRRQVRWSGIPISLRICLGSITKKKASGCDGIPAELFQILKDDAVKILYSICQQIWKTQQWTQDWKMSVFIPIPTGSSVHGIFSGNNTGLGCHFLLQGIFLTRESNSCLLHFLYR